VNALHFQVSYLKARNSGFEHLARSILVLWRDSFPADKQARRDAALRAMSAKPNAGDGETDRYPGESRFRASAGDLSGCGQTADELNS